MAKVLTFSTKFPAHHKRAGEPTFFHYKYLSSLKDEYCGDSFNRIIERLENHEFDNKILVSHITNVSNGVIGETKVFTGAKDIIGNIESKNHTIRSLSKNGERRWKEGEFFSPRIWTDKPYCSKQFSIGPDKKIEKVYDIEVDGYCIYINGEIQPSEVVEKLYVNDGLTHEDFVSWFKMPCQFKGQIIVWNKEIEY